MESGRDDLREPCGFSYEQLAKLTDERVMAHLAAGHGDAVAVLLDRYSRLVLSIAFKIVRDPSEAEDVAQEVFVAICRTAAQFDPAKGSTKMWIVRTAYRRSLTRRRNLKLRDSHFQGDLDELLNFSMDTDYAIASKLSSHESQRLVRQMLAKLDAAQRRVLELVFFHGLSMREAAEKTGSSLESVRHRYYRGIEKLRGLMDQTSGRDPKPAAREAINAKA
jgi:RNA polymerase sigma-70 factor (ECF subfamily)